MENEIILSESPKGILEEIDQNNPIIQIDQDKDEEIQNLKNKYLYLQADLENIKKRYNKQISDLIKYEGENIFKEIIEFIDFIQLQIDNYQDDQRLLDIKNRMLSLLNMFEVKPIYEERPMYFNDQYDEAILSKECNDKTLDNSIESVYKSGWLFKDKILRYEQVVVNKYNQK